MSVGTEQLFSRFFVEENQSECFRLLDEIGKHPLTERSIQAFSSKLISSTNSNIRKKIVVFLGERLRACPYTCEILSLLKRVVECDESAPVRSTAIEYIQAHEQKRSFSSVSSMLRSRSPSKDPDPNYNSPGYESDEAVSSSPKLSPPAKKKGKLVSLLTKIEQDNITKSKNDEEEIMKMNIILKRQKEIKEAKEAKELENKTKRKSGDVIDLTKYMNDDDDDGNSSNNKSLSKPDSSILHSSPSSSNSSPLKKSKCYPLSQSIAISSPSSSLSPLHSTRKLPPSFDSPLPMKVDDLLAKKLNQQKSSSLPLSGVREQTQHTKRANRNPILGGLGILGSSSDRLHRTSSSSSSSSLSSSSSTILNNGALGRTPAKEKFNPSDLLPLSEDQKAILAFAETRQSFFFTGAAGTGKSFVLRRLVKSMKRLYGDESVFVTASTGMAACNISGTTLHSFAGIGLGEKPAVELVNNVRRTRNAKSRWRRAKCLIVDEISMISGELFDKLEYVARVIREKSTPFGGIQVILCGDFFQLPPVFSGGDEKFCFEAETWDSVIKKSIELTTVFRQKDQSFIQLLNEVRIGKISKESWSKLQECCTRTLPNDGIEPTNLYSYRESVETENQRRLKELPSVSEQVFRAIDEYENESLKKLLDNLPVPSVLTLRIGAQVILLKNLDPQNELVNGAQGVVQAFSIGSEKKLFPIVKFKNGVVAQIECDTWEIESGSKVVASRKQVPLSLAWAISIHKSQGMTLSKVVMRLENVFSEGQAYVALSRVKSIDGLKINGKLPTERRLRPNQRVLDFYETFEHHQQQQQQPKRVWKK